MLHLAPRGWTVELLFIGWGGAQGLFVDIMAHWRLDVGGACGDANSFRGCWGGAVLVVVMGRVADGEVQW